MGLSSAFAGIGAHNLAIVMADTWGHLEATNGQRHYGWFTFIYGQHGDMAVIESHFPTFGEGPGYFSDRQEFIWQRVKDDGPCSEVGVYRFDGFYKLYADARSVKDTIGYFKGRVRRLELT